MHQVSSQSDVMKLFITCKVTSYGGRNEDSLSLQMITEALPIVLVLAIEPRMNDVYDIRST